MKVILFIIIYFFIYNSSLELENDRIFWAEDSIYIEGLEIKVTPVRIYGRKGKFTLHIKNNRGHDSLLAFKNLNVCGFNIKSSAIYLDILFPHYAVMGKYFYIIPTKGIDIDVYVSYEIKFIQHPNIKLCVYKKTKDTTLVQSLEASFSDRKRWTNPKKGF